MKPRPMSTAEIQSAHDEGAVSDLATALLDRELGHGSPRYGPRPWSDLAAALIEALDEAALDRLAEKLGPRLAGSLAAGAGPEPDRWLTTREAAERAGVHVQTIYRAVRTGSLAARRPGGATTGPLRIDPADLAAWMPAARVAGTARAAVPRPRRRSTPAAGPLGALLAAEAREAGCG